MKRWVRVEVDEEVLRDALRKLGSLPFCLELKDLLNGHAAPPGDESAEDLESIWEEDFAERIPERFLEKRSALGSAPPGEMLYASLVERGEGGGRCLLTAEMLDVVEMGGEEGVWTGENLAVTPPMTLRPQERELLEALAPEVLEAMSLPPGYYGVLFSMSRYGRVLRMRGVVQGGTPLLEGLFRVFSLDGGGPLPVWSGHLGSLTSRGPAAALNLEGILALQFLPESVKRKEELAALEEEELFEGMREGDLFSRAAHVMEALRRSLPLPRIFHTSRWDPLYVQKLWKVVKLMKRFGEESSPGWVFTTAQVGLLKKATRFCIPLTVLSQWTGLEMEELTREMRRFSVGYRLRLPHELNPLLPPGSRTALLIGEGRHITLKASPEGVRPAVVEGGEPLIWEGDVLVRGDGLKVVEAGGPGDAPEGAALFFSPSYRLEEYFPRESY